MFILFSSYLWNTFVSYRTALQHLIILILSLHLRLRNYEGHFDSIHYMLLCNCKKSFINMMLAKINERKNFLYLKNKKIKLMTIVQIIGSFFSMVCGKQTESVEMKKNFANEKVNKRDWKREKKEWERWKREKGKLNEGRCIGRTQNWWLWS